MEHRIITSHDEFLKLQAAWNELHACVGGSLFQLHEWLSEWWRVYGNSRSLSLHTFWNDALLVGVLPCFKEVKRFGPISYRRLSLLGEDEVYGEYCPMAESASCEEVAQSIASISVNELRRGDVEVIDFHGFPPDSRFMGGYLDWLRVGALVRYVPNSQPHFTIEGAKNGEEFLKLISHRRRRGLRRHERQLKQLKAEIEVITRWDGEAFDDLVRLHTIRWKSAGQPGRFASPRFTEFLRAVTERLMPGGMARIYFMRASGERISGVLAYRTNGRHYSYLVGRNPDHDLMRFSVGEVLFMRETMDAFDERMVSVDLMGGDYQSKHYTGITKRWYSRATAIASGARGAKGYLYWGGLAMRDALVRARQMRIHPEHYGDGEPASS